MPQGEGLLAVDDDDKKAMVRQGLLSLAAGIQSSRNFGEGLTQGLQGGLLAMNEGARQRGNDRYQQAIMGRTLAGMDRNAKIEGFQRELAATEDPLYSPTYRQYAAYAPQEAKAFRDAITERQVKWSLGELGDGDGGKLPVFYDPTSPGTVLDVSGQPMFGDHQPRIGGGADVVMGGALRDAVEWQESRGNPTAVSPAGAMGRMQTMPGTLAAPGFGVTPARDRSDAEMTRVGNEYLQAMVGKYGQEGGLAAYNWGPGNWESALQRSGGDRQRALQMAPKETQDYVPSVLSRAQGG